MPPTTLQKPKITPAGQRAANSIAEVRQNVNLGATPQQARATLGQINKPRTGFTVPMPDTVPGEALNGQFSIPDVRAARDSREQADMATAQFNTDYDNLTSRINNTTTSSPFANPEQFLNRLLLRGSTDTQQQLDAQGKTQADAIRGFAGEYTQAGEDARTQFKLPELQTELANTRNQIAERQVKLRETLRDFETNAERRGVAREFVDREKANVQAQAATELADLAIIESAQLGNLNEARTEIDNVLAEKRQAFEFENQAIEAEIARLEKMDTRESQARSEQLQIALTERNRNIETQLANEKEQRGYLADAAANGADQGTLLAIRNAKSPQEAAFLASPFIGRLDRMAKEANIAQSWESLDIRKQELALSRERLNAELTATGNTAGTVDGKPQNATQALVNSYANRLLESETVFDAVADQFSDPLAFGSVLPSLMQSGERQQYEQAKRNFVNSVLRRESGAVISDQEFKNAELQYFPQAGDKPETVLQKEQNRNTVINNFYREANVPRPVFSGDIIESNGKKYQVAEDGVTLIEI